VCIWLRALCGDEYFSCSLQCLHPPEGDSVEGFSSLAFLRHEISGETVTQVDGVKSCDDTEER
jgi:hypothetical protein